MKTFIISILFIVINEICVAQVGIELNGTFYADGTTALIPCGTQSLYARVKDGTLYRFCSGVLIQPDGWSFTGNDSHDKCPNFQTTTTTGGTLRIKYLYSLNGQTNYVSINIERPVPSSFGIMGPSAVCSGSTQTFSLNNPPPGVTDWTTGPNLVRTGANGGTSTQITYSSNGSSSVSVSINTSNGCGVVSRTSYLNAGTPLVEYPNLWLFDSGSNMWQFSHAVSPGTISWTYYVAAGSAFLNQQGGDCYITTTDGASVCVYGTNSCGQASAYCFNVPAAGGGYMRAASPNPTKDQLTLQFTNTRSLQTLPSDVYLYAENSTKAVRSIAVGDVYKRQAFEEGDKIKVPVGDLPRGIYYLHVIPNQDSKQPTQKIRVILE
jgi:hypothetical protein